jgi:hypothetical protein
LDNIDQDKELYFVLDLLMNSCFEFQLKMIFDFFSQDSFSQLGHFGLKTVKLSHRQASIQIEFLTP